MIGRACLWGAGSGRGLPEFKVRQSSFLPALFVCGKNPGTVNVWTPASWGSGTVGQDSPGRVVLLNAQCELGLGKAPPPPVIRC